MPTKSWKDLRKKRQNRKLFGYFALSVFLLFGLTTLVHRQWDYIAYVLALTSVSLNGGTTTLSTYSDLTSSTVGLGPDTGAYTWTVDGGSLMALNMPVNAGGTQTDFSGEGNDGTNTNGPTIHLPSSANCQVGSCIELEEVNSSYIRIVDDASLEFSRYTLSAWVNLSSAPALNNIYTIIHKGTTDGGFDRNGYFLDYRDTSGTKQLSVGHVNASNGFEQIFSDVTLTPGIWYHVVGSYDGASLNLYIDGSLIETSAFSNDPDYIGDVQDLKIGAKEQIGGIDFEFDGFLDEVKIFDRALSQEAITSLFLDEDNSVGGPTTIVDDETLVGEVWDLDITPIDNTGAIGTPVSASDTVTIVISTITVGLNGGVSPISTYADIPANITGLGDPQAAYTWTVDGSNLQLLNMPFNPGSAQTDYSGKGNNGTTSSNPLFLVPGSTGCQVGGCIEFDGVDDWVDLPSDLFEGEVDFSVDAWISLETLDSAQDGQAIISALQNGGVHYASFLVMDSGEYRVLVSTGAGSNCAVSATHNLVVNQLTHVAFTRSDDVISIYENGVLLNTESVICTGGISVNPGGTRIGAHDGAPAVARPLDGIIDEIHVFDRALSQSQITQLYNDGLANLAGPTQIVSAQTTGGETWDLDVTPFESDGTPLTLVNSSNTVTVSSPAVTAQLNLGTPTLGTYVNLATTVTGLGAPQAAYEWTIDGNDLYRVNMPFNPGTPQTDFGVVADNGSLESTPVFHSAGSGNCKVGGCLQFDGVDDAVNLPETTDLEFGLNDSFSIEAWVNPDSIGSLAWIFSQQRCNAGRIALTQNSGGQPSLRIDDLSGNLTNSPATTAMMAGNWYHLVGVRDVATDRVYMYLDGVLEGNVFDNSVVGLTNASTESKIGLRYPCAATEPFAGYIDEFKIYDRALTPDQVLQNYNDGNAGNAGPTQIVDDETRIAEVWDLEITPFESSGIALTPVSSSNTATITAPAPVVQLNSGASPLSTYLDLESSVTNIYTPQAAYGWTVDGNNLMVLNMPFNAETVQTDFSGEGNNGTKVNVPNYHSPAYGNCQVGGCMEFDGSDEYITATTTNFPTGSQPRSVSLWFKTDSTANQSLFAYGTDTNDQAFYILQNDTTDCGAEGGSNLSGTVVVGTYGGGSNICAGPTTSDGAWHHVVAIYDGSDIQIYLDNVLQNSGPRTASTTSGTLLMGTFFGGTLDLAGFLDEVQVYNRVLSSTEITQLYNDGIANTAGPTEIVTLETDSGEVWDLDITPFESDGSALSLVPSGNTVTIAAPTVVVDLNGGVSPLSTYSDLAANITGLGAPQGAYTWTIDGNNLMELNIPFNPGGTQLDYSGNTNNGTNVNGPVYHLPGSGNCQVGGCMEFDGDNDLVSIPHDASLNFADSDFSVDFWMNTTDSPAATGFLVAKHACGFGNGWRVEQNIGAGTIRGAVHTSGVSTITSVNDGSWHHIAFTFDADYNEIRMYVDGVLDNSGIGVDGTSSGNVVTIGSSLGGTCSATTQPYTGFIDEVHLYGRTLSPDQITELYNDGNTNNAGPTQIEAEETVVSEVWDLDITPFESDGSAFSVVNSANTVTISAPTVTVGLNNVIPLLADNQDLATQITGLGAPQAAYTWTIDGANLMALQIPFNSGATQIDYSGETNNGTNTNGPVFIPSGSGGCQVGGCMVFDGVDDYVDVLDDPSLDFGTGDFTIEAWINTTDNTLNQYIVDHRNAGPYNTGYLLHILSGSGGRVRFFAADGSFQLLDSIGSVSNNTWHHIVATREGNTGRIYIDGALDNSGSVGVGDTSVTNEIRIGAGNDGLGQFFNGKIDEVRLYPRALSLDQVMQNYNDGNTNNSGPSSIADEETTLSEVWDLDITPFDSNGSALSLVNSANTVTIFNNTPPSEPTIISPSDAETVSSITPTLSARFIDVDPGQSGTTSYRISSGSPADCLSNTNIVDSGASAVTGTNNEATTYTVGVNLTNLATYNWCARNSDGVDLSNLGNFTTMGSFLVDTSFSPGGGIGTILQNQQNQGGGENQEVEQEDLDIDSFGIDFAFTDVNEEQLPETLLPDSILFGTVTLTNSNDVIASDVFFNLSLPSFVDYVPGSLQINNQVQTSQPDEDAGQANANAVSAIWATLDPNAIRTVTFQLLTRDAARASALEEIAFQATVSASNANEVFSSDTLIFSLDLPDEIEPEPVEPEPVEPEPVEPEPESSPEPETTPEPAPTTTPIPTEPSSPVIPLTPAEPVDEPNSQNEQELDQGVGEENDLFITGNVQSQNEQVQFSGTVNEPNAQVIVIINGQTFTVVSDETGFWQAFVSAEEIGIQENSSQQIDVEAYAVNTETGRESNRISQQIFVERFGEALIVDQVEIVQSSNTVTRAISELSSQVREIIEQQEEEIQTTLAIAAPVVVVTSVPLWGYLPYVPTMFFHLISWIVGLLGRKKQQDDRFYGIVYDSISKQPLSLAIVRIYKLVDVEPGVHTAHSRQLVTTVVTDKQGRYEALLQPGEYVFEVKKPQFTFPSSIVTASSDGEYTHIYQGKVSFEQQDTLTIPDIPLDPENTPKKWQTGNAFKKLWMALQKVGNYLAVPVLFLGAASAVLVLVNDVSNPINWILAILYVFLLIMQITFRTHPQRAWGMVYDVATNAALPLTTLQLIDPEFGKVVKSRLSDYEGRFSFLPEPGKYVIKASKEGYTQAELVESRKEHNPIQGEVTIQKVGEKIDGDIAMRSR